MLRKSWPILFSSIVGLGIGLALNRVSSVRPAYAQDGANAAQSNRILVQGHGRAVSALAPPGEQFSLSPSNAPRTSFTVVPAGKQFVLTDVMYEAQGSVRQPLTVNIANANLIAKKHDILFQVSLEPMKSDQVHLCSGYVIPAGNSLVAYTNNGMAPEQYVSISITGYLIDQ
ncbi:MAG: hypothetical protein QOG23_811 [Blastocatellia bacterium]|jgi:hypothetical protein|nr:hypothetical protein [Blastocatellia bacterium]